MGFDQAKRIQRRGENKGGARPLDFSIVLIAILVLSSLLAPQKAHAEVYRLFDASGAQTPEYNANIAQLSTMTKGFPPMTELEFSGGRRIRVVSFLGKGGTTAIFLTADGFALRVPLARGYSEDGYHTYTDFISATWNAYLLLRHLPVARLDRHRSSPPQYLLAEYVPVQFTLQDFYKSRGALIDEGRLRQDEVASIEAQLFTFAEQFYKVRELWDFWPKQIAWDGASWKLLDYSVLKSHPFRAAKFVNDPTLFDQFAKPREEGVDMPESVATELRRRVLARRAQDADAFPSETPGFCSRLIEGARRFLSE